MAITYNNLRLKIDEKFRPDYHPVVIFDELPEGRVEPKAIESKEGPIEVLAGRDRKTQKYLDNWKKYYEKKGLIKRDEKPSAESSFVPANP